ncbi:hypothetical protein N0B44_06465 [Roseibacterium beibuensis]|uniref:hypothetical protein n=1 Tax=[Roseibacterium] beibuensis TaxID=1193142 RepID=UPI00217E1316|nr:hypothetical protein [Roseibacterium beibuensis]MCS6622545.1 hypothetical protein [Roseibacterium beibuensis]
MADSLKISLADEGDVWAWRVFDHQANQIDSGTGRTADEALNSARLSAHQALNEGLENSLRDLAYARSSLVSPRADPNAEDAWGRRISDGWRDRSPTADSDPDGAP